MKFRRNYFPKEIKPGQIFKVYRSKNGIIDYIAYWKIKSSRCVDEWNIDVKMDFNGNKSFFNSFCGRNISPFYKNCGFDFKIIYISNSGEFP